MNRPVGTPHTASHVASHEAAIGTVFTPAGRSAGDAVDGREIEALGESAGPAPARRALWWVGSLPPEIATTDEDRISWVLDESRGHDLIAVPSDPDPLWIINWLRDLGTNPALRTVLDGDYRDYSDFRVYRPTHPALDPDVVSLDLADHVAYLVTELEEQRYETGHPNALVQVSWPSPLDRALFTFAAEGVTPTGSARLTALRHAASLARALRHLPAFVAADRADIGRVAVHRGQDVLIQLESPAVLYALRLAPPGARLLVAKLLARHVARLLATVPAHIPTALHLCVGNLGDTELFQPTDLADHVTFLNQLARHLRRLNRPLPFVHIPAAYGAHPPPTHARYYAPLRRLNSGFSLVAGVVDENDHGRSRRALWLFEEAAGRRAVAVATTCGLGRHTAEASRRAAEVMRQLATVTAPRPRPSRPTTRFWTRARNLTHPRTARDRLWPRPTRRSPVDADR